MQAEAIDRRRLSREERARRLGELAGDLEQTAFSSVLDKRELERAELVARKTLAAKPANLPERMWLVRILMAQGRTAMAEAVIREAVSLVRDDPDGWILLVGFLTQTKQPAEAFKAIKEAESALRSSAAPLALANCYSLLGGATKGPTSLEKQKAYALARIWYTKALADQPDDLAAAHSAADFFSKTNQPAELEAQLGAILKRGSKTTSPWARRKLALLLASSADLDRVHRALSMIEPSDQGAKDLQGSKRQEDVDDLPQLVRVLEAQKTVAHCTRAVDILESLVANNLANGEDRLMLARLEEMRGHWPKALDIFRDPKVSRLNIQDRESVTLRPYYLAQFAMGLLRNRKPGNDEDLAEAQKLVDELKQLRPEPLDTLMLRVEVCRPESRSTRHWNSSTRPHGSQI